MNIIFSFLIFGMLLGLGVLVKHLYKKLINANEKYENLLKKNILEDLDLATTEQLFDEIKKRHDKPFIIIFPEDKASKMGIKMDVSNLTPEQLLDILRTTLTVVSNKVANND